jgi:hypothetical protein
MAVMINQLRRHRRMTSIPARPRSSGNRRGMALPLVLLLVAVLSATLAASFATTSGEHTMEQSLRAENRAFTIAQSGLEAYMSGRMNGGVIVVSTTPADKTPPDVTSEVVKVAVPSAGGIADTAFITATRVRPMTGARQAMYVVQSRGVDFNARGLSGRARARPERTIAQMATFNTFTINVIGAWTSLTGLTKNGTGEISGIDQCGARSAVAGVVTSKGDFVNNGNASLFLGNPPVDTASNTGEVKDRINIDWDGIINKGALPADYTIPPQSFPTAAQFADPNFWPVIRINSSGYSLPVAGKGIIIATGNFDINGSNMWDGIILVGGVLTSNGNNVTAGTTLSGLNALLPGAPLPPPSHSGDNADANGQKSYVYNSCNVDRATKGLQSFQPIANAWVDNIATY